MQTSNNNCGGAAGILKLLHGDKKIDEHLIEHVTPIDCKLGRLHLLCKIHNPGNPGRTIVFSSGTVTEKLPSFVDHLIKNRLETLDSRIKDINHFLNNISELHVPHGALLVNLDVSSLYTNIPRAEGH